MKRSLSEHKVLNKLGITDFQRLSKDKAIRFDSMLPYMNPEMEKKRWNSFLPLPSM